MENLKLSFSVYNAHFLLNYYLLNTTKFYNSATTRNSIMRLQRGLRRASESSVLIYGQERKVDRTGIL